MMKKKIDGKTKSYVIKASIFFIIAFIIILLFRQFGAGEGPAEGIVNAFLYGIIFFIDVIIFEYMFIRAVLCFYEYKNIRIKLFYHILMIAFALIFFFLMFVGTVIIVVFLGNI